MIRPAIVPDADSIARIYNYYIANSTATFEEEAISSEDIYRRLNENSAAELPWLVAVDD